MKAVKSSGTAPEMAMRRILWNAGLRYRLHKKELPGKPDIVFTRAKVAVFVDGDFWHGNQWRLRGFKSLEDQLEKVGNRAYWENKIRKNIQRDRAVDTALRKAGWKVIRIWESQVKRNPARAAARVIRSVSGRAL